MSKYVESFNFKIKRLRNVSTSVLIETLIIERKAYSLLLLEIKNEGKDRLFFDETGLQITIRNHG